MAQNTGDNGRAWAEALVRQIGNTAKELRGKRSAKWLSDRTAELGHRIPATVIAKLDSGHRGAVLSLPELLVLAAALGAPPLALLIPTDTALSVEALPGRAMPVTDFIGWLTDTTEASPAGVATDPDAREKLALVTALNSVAQRIELLRHNLLEAERPLSSVRVLPELEERRAADTERYREMLASAVEDHARIVHALAGERPEGGQDAS